MPRRSALALLAALVALAACTPIRPAPAPSPVAPSGVAAARVLVNDPINPGYKSEDFPDPFVLTLPSTFCGASTGPCYFAYSTAHAEGIFPINVPVRSSTNLLYWNYAGQDWPGTTIPTSDAMPQLASWVDPLHNWAPSVSYVPTNPSEQQFVMYYTARSAELGKQCVGIATSASPRGPFVDSRPTPFVCQLDRGGTIDASPFVDWSGDRYLLYKSEDSTLWSARMSGNGLAVAPPRALLALGSGPSWERPRIEGPSMLRAPTGVLFLFYSAGEWSTAAYGVAVARCDTPQGPCRRVYSTQVLKTRETMAGPGGQTSFSSLDGTPRLAFHAWHIPQAVGYPNGQRSLRILPITFTGPGGNPKIG